MNEILAIIIYNKNEKKNRRYTRRKRWILSYCPGFLELVPE
jgi:hypothetical protein